MSESSLDSRRRLRGDITGGDVGEGNEFAEKFVKRFPVEYPPRYGSEVNGPFTGDACGVGVVDGRERRTKSAHVEKKENNFVVIRCRLYLTCGGCSVA